MKKQSVRMTDRGRAIAKRVGEMRRLCGLTQADLAERVGITYQQVFKYETGENRIAADRLADIADAMDVHISWFYETGPIHSTFKRKAA